MLFWPSEPLFSGFSSTKSPFVCSRSRESSIGKPKNKCIHLDIIPDGDILAKRQPHPASNICALARRQPHPAEIRRWRRQSVQMGRQICVRLSSSNPVDRYNLADRPFPRSRELFRTDRGRPCPREWEDPQAKRCGGMERSGSLCGRVAAPRETLHGRECGSIGKLLLAGGTDADWQRAPWKTVECGNRNKRRQGKQPAGREQHRKATCRQGAPSGSSKC